MSPSDLTITGFACLLSAVAISFISTKKFPLPGWVYDILFVLISIGLLMIVLGAHPHRV